MKLVRSALTKFGGEKCVRNQACQWKDGILEITLLKTLTLKEGGVFFVGVIYSFKVIN